MAGEDRTVEAVSRAAGVIAAIVGVRTAQLEMQILTNRYRGRMTAERRYRTAELRATLADLRAELEACEHELPSRDPTPRR